MDRFLGFLAKVLFCLVPPQDAEPAHVRAYRSTVSFLILLTLLGGIGFTSLALGLIPGMSGFAWAKTVRDNMTELQNHQDVVDKDFKVINIGVTEDHLKTALREACTAIDNNNQLALDGANSEINRLGDLYYALTKREYPRQTCDVILIKKKAGD